MVMKQQLPVATLLVGVVALSLALLEPAAAAGLKFTTADLDSEESTWELYERWGARFNVARDPAEKLRRFHNFKETARRVASRAAAGGGGGGRAPGLNAFADLTLDEFTRDYKCRKATTATERELRNRNGNLTGTAAPPAVKRRGGGGDLPLPSYWDWRDKTCGDQQCLGPVKDQGSCGSCWAFAATGAMESHHAIVGARNRVKPVHLSEQELVDCDAASHKCAGGFAVNAFQYVIHNGVAPSASYPYKGVNGTCHARATPREQDLVMRGFEETRPNDEYQLLSAVVIGPVVVSIAVGDNNTDFADYEGGTYGKDNKCGGGPNDHELLLVGYDDTTYLLKNSYGDDWGDEGYLLLPRPDTRCGMLRDGGSYPNIGI